MATLGLELRNLYLVPNRFWCLNAAAILSRVLGCEAEMKGASCCAVSAKQDRS